MTINDNNSLKADFMRFFSISEADIRDLDISYDGSGGLIVHVALNQSLQTCPVCGSSTSKVKDYTTRHITHAMFSNRRCTIEYRARRYFCPECGKSFYEEDPFCYPESRYSYITVYNVLNELHSVSATFTSVARQFSLSPSTVMSIFDRNIHIPRKQLPRYLCIDEVYAFSDVGTHSNYVCVLLDFETGKVIDLLPSRHKKDLVSYFSRIPEKERENVEIVSIDMWATYDDISRLFFRKAAVQVDRFHVEQQFFRLLQNVRIRTMNSIKDEYDQLYIERKFIKNRSRYEDLPPDRIQRLIELDNTYYVFKKFNWLLNKHGDYPELRHDHTKKFNHKLGIYTNLFDLLWIMLDSSDELLEIYNFYEQLHGFYQCCSFQDAPQMVTELIREARNSGVRELNEFANTMTNWKRQIINSMIEVEEPIRITNPRIRKKKSINEKRKRIRHVSNGIIENRNREIKKLKDVSSGYRNWERFRNRVMFCLNEELSTININPENKKRS